jgi:competence protein ComEA
LTGPERKSGAEAGRRPEGSLAEDLVLLLLAVTLLLVPAFLRQAPAGPAREEAVRLEPVRIDVNRAAWFEWTLIDGIGEARARRIVEDRETRGPFHSLDDLKRIPGMPAGWVEKAREHLSLGN